MLKQLWESDVVEHTGPSQSKAQPEYGLSAFRDGASKILVTTDALTRGVDIPGIDLVINYDAAVYPKTYVHRAGRTARAGNKGMLCPPCVCFLVRCQYCPLQCSPSQTQEQRFLKPRILFLIILKV